MNKLNLVFAIVWFVMGVLYLLSVGTFWDLNGHIRILLGLVHLDLYLTTRRYELVNAVSKPILDAIFKYPNGTIVIEYKEAVKTIKP